MKNLTITLDDETYDRACAKAAEGNESISDLVQRLIAEATSDEGRFARLLRLEEETRAEIKNFRAGERLTRDEVHERHR